MIRPIADLWGNICGGRGGHGPWKEVEYYVAPVVFHFTGDQGGKLVSWQCKNCGIVYESPVRPEDE